MASIEDALYSRLTAVSGVTDLVSTRIYPDRKDLGDKVEFPYVTYSLTGSTRVSAMGSDPGMVESEIRCHIWTKDTDSASGFDVGRNVADEIRQAVQRYSGTSAGVTVHQIFIDFEAAIDEPEPGVFHRVIDLDCRWFE